jgi:hypothetical protein
MTEEEEDALFELRLRAFMAEDERRLLEIVSPKMEQARNFKGFIIGARGGRSAGAKTTSMVSLLVQESHREFHRVVALREIQASLEESLYQSVQEAVDRLRYPGWRFPRTRGYCESPVGSRWVFRGLKDLTAANNTKGLQGFDRYIADEAAQLSGASIDVLLPLIGKNKGSKFFFAFNPETEADPIVTKVWLPFQNDPDVLLLDMLPEGADNPWWNELSQKLSDTMRREEPDLWEHVYGGKPRSQGQMAVLSRLAIRSAMDRTVEAGQAKELGIDVARFGDDKSTFYLREGMKITQHREVSKFDTQEVARVGWDMVNRDREVPIKVDVGGLGAGVVDKLKDLGAKVIEVAFGGDPKNKDKYTSAADEMWFEFGEILADVQLPNNDKLMEELSGRQYTYTRHDQRKIGTKADFKKRLGRSPDHADGCLLAFYRPKAGPLEMSAEFRAKLAARRNR